MRPIWRPGFSGPRSPIDNGLAAVLGARPPSRRPLPPLLRGPVGTPRPPAPVVVCRPLPSRPAPARAPRGGFGQARDPPHVLAWEEACARAAEAGARAIEGYERMVFDDI